MREAEADLYSSLVESEEGGNERAAIQQCADIQEAIQEGASAFLTTEYRALSLFLSLFAIGIFVFLASEDSFNWRWKEDDQGILRAPSSYNGLWSAVAFLVGAVTSIACGYIGMGVATFANARVALEARRGLDRAFAAAFRSGAATGFLLPSLALLVLFLLMNVYHWVYGRDWEGLFEALTGFGLGGSTIALFGRVAGGTYTKAADVGADLVGKIEQNIPEDSPKNPATIADNVGDNVGDVAGMGSDLFGSFAESTAAALVIASLSSLGAEHSWTGLLYPLLISAVGILVRPASAMQCCETVARQVFLSACRRA